MKTNNLFKTSIIAICFLCCGFHVMGKDTTLRFTWKDYFNATYNQNVLTENLVLGDYFYESSKPHALTQVELFDPNTISLDTCMLTYTPFNKVKTIEEGDYFYEIKYYPNKQQAVSILKEDNTIISQKYYVGKAYEYESITNTHYHYVYANGKPVAVFIKQGNNAAVPYLIHTDRLGSIDVITDINGNIVDSMDFDAWGNRRDRKDWTQKESNVVHLIDRGFTGHQHLDVFNLINMRGRMYDPVVGQFLSPDPYVPAPDNIQSYNRYAYCFNSPLMYVDPTGEHPAIIFAIAAIAVSTITCSYLGGVTANGGEYNPSKWDWGAGKTWAGIGIGAAIGVGVGIGASYAAPALAGTAFFSHFGTTGMIAAYGITGAVALGAGGYASGFLSGLAYSNGNLQYANQAGLMGLEIGSMVGTVVGTAIGAIAGYNPPEIRYTPAQRSKWDGSFFQGSEEDVRQMLVSSSKSFDVETAAWYTSRGYYFEPIEGEAYGITTRKDGTFISYNAPIGNRRNVFGESYLYSTLTEMGGNLYLNYNGYSPLARIYDRMHVHPGGNAPNIIDQTFLNRLKIPGGRVFGWDGSIYYYNSTRVWRKPRF